MSIIDSTFRNWWDDSEKPKNDFIRINYNFSPKWISSTTSLTSLKIAITLDPQWNPTLHCLPGFCNSAYMRDIAMQKEDIIFASQIINYEPYPNLKKELINRYENYWIEKTHKELTTTAKIFAYDAVLTNNSMYDLVKNKTSIAWDLKNTHKKILQSFQSRNVDSLLTINETVVGATLLMLCWSTTQNRSN